MDQNIKITNPNKILFPQSKITKKELINYYTKIAPFMLRLIKNHPITMHRFPNGINKKGFYQKDISDFFPIFIERIQIKQIHTKKITTYPLCNNLPSIEYLANQAVITFHMWQSSIKNIKKPNRMIFDFDPSKENDFKRIKFFAKKLKTLLENIGLIPLLMTSGSKGLHIVVPLKPEKTFKEIKSFATKIAKQLVEKYPEDLTLELRKEKRGTKIFIDTLRNQWAQLSVCPYSVRAIKEAPIATPIDWKELNKANMNPQYFNIKNIFKRLSKKDCPWKKFF